MSKIIIPSTNLNIENREVSDFLNSLVEDGTFWGYIISLIEQDNIQNINNADMTDIKSLIESMSAKLDNLKVSSSETVVTRIDKSEEPKEENSLMKFINEHKSTSMKADEEGDTNISNDDDDFDDILGGFGLE